MNPSHDIDRHITQLQRMIRSSPDDHDAASDLAVLLAQKGRTVEAQVMLEEKINLGVQNPAIRHNLAEIYRQTGNDHRAELLFNDLLTEQPFFLPAYQSLILLLTQRLAGGTLTGEERLNIASRLSVLNNNLGNALLEHGRLEEAKSAYREALRYQKDYPAALSNLSNVLRMMGRPSVAQDYAQRALAMNPDFAQAWNNLGTALSEQNRYEEAEKCYTRAMQLDPAMAEARHNATSGSLMMQLYREDWEAEQIVEAHRRFGASFPLPQKPLPVLLTEKIRVGFLSGDFREHSVMYFVEPLLEKLDRSRFEIFCYANQNIEDNFTRRIQSLVLTWKNIFSVSDEALCKLFQEDRLHLLIDLSGHTQGCRLNALARKPVCVMAHFIGYPSTTGLPAMDYRLSDRHTDPEALAPVQNTEKVIYLAPSQFNYRPRIDAPEVSSLPALKTGKITFGSLNNVQKLNCGVVAAWSRILLDVPESRLIIHHKFMADFGVAGRFRGMFEAFGVRPGRLDFHPADDHHLTTYHDIDIALDPFPYNGATTTCEALWMGVPVVVLAGDRSAGRMGVSLLAACGMEDWIAPSVDDYIQLAIAQCSDIPNLSQMRVNLRTRLRQSPLCDEDTFAAAFAEAIEIMVNGG
ncbi:MAG TPA: tetratricopeptide repeat protein [Smithellaceae bacterium]|nr:tetratricopeptide repeat protein [Smithellaceae bacterium]HQM44664.1 tetratricopeptide repeat protein [Smithellaceae bacterium]